MNILRHITVRICETVLFWVFLVLWSAASAVLAGIEEYEEWRKR